MVNLADLLENFEQAIDALHYQIYIGNEAYVGAAQGRVDAIRTHILELFA